MKAMILAAGRGERMRPLTDTTPKPLLEVGGKSLIAWQIERLVAAGFRDLVINHAWLGERIEAQLGDGSKFGASIRYSHEPEALETLGGIVNALSLLTDGKSDCGELASAEPFVVVSADVYTNFDYRSLAARVESIAAGYPDHVAHFVLTDNPPFHPSGDMALTAGRVTLAAADRLNYGNIAVFHPAVFADVPRGKKLKLFPWAFRFVDEGRVSGEHFRGVWENVGSVGQLAELDGRLSGKPRVH